ncbi:hypothetical protein BGZ94_003040 [Podila epigama]|nr:hypothetical protein BGZ94_003040 [Podila epigama]
MAILDSVFEILTAHPGIKYGVALLAYMAYVRSQRFRRINALLAKYPDPTLPLRNIDIARECCANVSDLEFPYMNVTSLEFSLFKTFGIPSVSKVLVATKQLTHDCLRRSEDTVFFLLEMTELHSRGVLRTINEGKHDPEAIKDDHKRFQTSLDRINFLHSHYKIKNDEYLYSLALFILEPPVMIAAFDWRELTLLERNALLAHWTFIGKGMGIKDIPDNLEELAAWTEEFESKNARLHDANVKIADATVELLLSITPKFTHGVLMWGVSAMLSERFRVAFGFAPPPPGVTTFVHTLLWLRGRFIRYFMLPRRKPRVRTGLRRDSHGKFVPAFHKFKPIVYPNGYRTEELGPDKFRGKCPVATISDMASPNSAFFHSEKNEE